MLAPHRFPPRIEPTARNGRSRTSTSPSRNLGPFCDFGCDDAVTLCTQYSTQWDSFAHIGEVFDADGDGTAELVLLQRLRCRPRRHRRRRAHAGDCAQQARYRRICGAAIQGRGVLIDLEAPSRPRETHDRLSRDRRGHTARTGCRSAPATSSACTPASQTNCLTMGRAPDRTAFTICVRPSTARTSACLTGSQHTEIAALVADNYAVERIELRPGSWRTIALRAIA